MSNDLPEQHNLPLSDNVSMEFRLLPAGEFRMGARGYNAVDEPIHRVVITEPFYLGMYPATQRQFSVWTQAAGIDHKNRFYGHPDHPAENLDWSQSQDFCQWLNERCVSTIPEKYVAGLPSEAQWEYACRLMKGKDGEPVAVDTEYYTGDGEAALSQAGWYGEKFGEGSTHPVGSESKRPTDFGLHDMHGNVWEWCRDAWSEEIYKWRIDGVRDPLLTPEDLRESGESAVRVIRGGGWIDSAGDCRAAYRSGLGPGNRGWLLGFRVCLFSGPAKDSHQPSTAVTSEPGAGDGARRDAVAESEDSGGDVTQVDWSEETLPKRSDGTKF